MRKGKRKKEKKKEQQKQNEKRIKRRENILHGFSGPVKNFLCSPCQIVQYVLSPYYCISCPQEIHRLKNSGLNVLNVL